MIPKRTYAQAKVAKKTIKSCLLRTATKGSLGGARNTAISRRKLPFWICSIPGTKQSRQATYRTEEILNFRYHEEHHRHPGNHCTANDWLEFGPSGVLEYPLGMTIKPLLGPAY